MVIVCIMLSALGVILYTVLSVRIKVSDTKGIVSVKRTGVSEVATTAIPAAADETPAEEQPQVVEPAHVEEYAPVEVNFDELAAINADVTAWIYSEGTDVDYPVVQRDNTYYLNHSFDGKEVSRGALFVHEDNAGDFSDENTCIYGHNMTRTGDGVMFSSIVSYKQQSYYEAHPVMYLLTPQGDYRVDIFAAYPIDIFEDSVPLRFEDEADYQRYLDEIRERSDIVADVEVTSEDKIVTLITCTQDHKSSERYIVAGKLTKIGL